MFRNDQRMVRERIAADSVENPIELFYTALIHRLSIIEIDLS